MLSKLQDAAGPLSEISQLNLDVRASGILPDHSSTIGTRKGRLCSREGGDNSRSAHVSVPTCKSSLDSESFLFVPADSFYRDRERETAVRSFLFQRVSTRFAAFAARASPRAFTARANERMKDNY